MDIKELAKYALSFFETFEREKPAETFYKTKRRHPTWLHEMIFAVHDNGKIMPDDYKYEFIVNALDALVEGMDPDEPELEADVYNSALLAWLGSHSERVGYVNEATKDMGHSDLGIMGDIMSGQWREKEEVFGIVVQALRKRLDAIEDGVRETFETDPKGVKEWRPPPS
jgi:hypothetical protein